MLIGQRQVALCFAVLAVAAAGCDPLIDEIKHGWPKPGAGGGSSPPPSGGPNSPGSPGAPGSQCFGAGMGAAPPVRPEQCRSAGDWKQQAYESCTAAKAVLVDLKLSQPCGADLYAGMEYQCCTSTGTAPPPPPPDPSPPVTACFDGVLDEGAVCVAADLLKRRASEICSLKGFVLTAMGLGGACADGVSFVGAKYQCCELAPPTPPTTPTTPPSSMGGGCRSGREGGPTSCKDTSTWKSYAESNCASTGMRLAKFQTVESCGPDLFRYSDYACCTP